MKRMDSEEYCILLGCENYFQAYPSEDLGECILDKKDKKVLEELLILLQFVTIL